MTHDMNEKKTDDFLFLFINMSMNNDYDMRE